MCGGGTKSTDWMQVLSDILGIELDIIDSEGPAIGGALLASGKSVIPKEKYTVSPNADLTGIYSKKYSKRQY